ncbi:MAG: hypothetical protein WCK03_01360 [Candidatus Taylorbacteria bacterium]
MKKSLEIAIPFLFIIAVILYLFAYLDHSDVHVNIGPYQPVIYGPGMPPKKPIPASNIVIIPKPQGIPVHISAQSPEIFAYAHGTVTVHNKIFIGMASRSGNLFPTNQLFVFTNPYDLKQFHIISIPRTGDIESMIYDEKNNKIYFTLSNNGSLGIYSIDPNTYRVSTIISTTSINIGLKPAITTDGKFIYGITYTNPSTIFKIGIYGGPLTISEKGHISNGHSAAIGIYGSSTELYFGGGEADLFEKVDANDLSSLGMLYFPSCSITDDMPYQATNTSSGYVYLGCEKQNRGIRIRTDDLSYVDFILPGNSFGMYKYGNDLYNAAQDGNYDIFENMDITKLKRYYVGRDIQLNELFVIDNLANITSTSSLSNATSTVTDMIGNSKRLYFTGWWGVKGLFEVASSTGI